MTALRPPVSAEESAAILRLHHVEKWPVGTIASQLGRHHDTVERVLAHGGLPVTKQTPRARLVDPYLPFIEETLAKYPRLRASRLLSMVKSSAATVSAARPPSRASGVTAACSRHGPRIALVSPRRSSRAAVPPPRRSAAGR